MIDTIIHNNKHSALKIAILHIILSFFWQKHFFPEIPQVIDILSVDFDRSLFILFSHILSILIIISSWQFLFYIFSKNVNQEFRKFFFLFFIPFLFVATLVYPSMYGWAGDCLYIYQQSLAGIPYYWHNYFTSTIYLATYLSFVHPISLPILQSCIGSIIAAYTTTQLYSLTSKKILRFFIIAMFFIEDSFIIFLEPYRNCFYTLLSLVFFAVLFFPYIKNDVLSWKSVFILSILAGILVFWRSEGILYAVLLPLIVLSMYRFRSLKKMITILLIMMLIFFTLSVPQNLGSKKHHGLGYVIINMVSWLSDIVKYENFNYEYVGYTEDLRRINSVIDMSYIRMLYGPSAFSRYTALHGGLNHLHSTIQEQKGFISATYNIVAHNKMNFIKGRIKTFLIAMGTLQLIKKATEIFGQYDKLRTKLRSATGIKPHISDKERPYDIQHALDEYFFEILPKAREKLDQTILWKAALRDKILQLTYVPRRYYHLSSLLLAICVRMFLVPFQFFMLFLTFKQRRLPYFMCFFTNIIMLCVIIIFAPDTYVAYYYPHFYVASLLTLIYFTDKNRQERVVG